MAKSASVQSSKITEPIVIAEWWKNRRKESIRVRLSEYEGLPLFDLRTWFTGSDGALKPGKGFASSIKHLPRIAAEINKALAKARELGLIVDQDAEHE